MKMHQNARFLVNKSFHHLPLRILLHVKLTSPMCALECDFRWLASPIYVIPSPLFAPYVISRKPSTVVPRIRHNTLAVVSYLGFCQANTTVNQSVYSFKKAFKNRIKGP